MRGSFKRFNLLISIYYLEYIMAFLVGGEIAQSVVSLSAMQSVQVRACFRKVVCCHSAIELFPPVPTTGSKKAVHVSLCLYNDACKRSLAICHKSTASCPFSRLLSVPIWPACAKQGRKYDSIN